MSNPRLDLYRIFMTAAAAGSFTEAGNRLFMTQSAVSQSMAQLEQILETRLFYRSGRGVALTSEGETLKIHLDSAFQSIATGEHALSALKNLEAGVLHIAASDTLCRHFLLPFLQTFHERYPDIHLQVTNRPSPVCLEMVQRKEADLGFVNRSSFAPPLGVVLDDVLEYEDIFVASQAFYSCGTVRPSLAEMVREPLILLEEGSSTRENLYRWALSEELPLTPGIEVGSVDVILDLVRIGLGIGWIPGYALPEGPDAGLFHIETRHKPPIRQVSMAHAQRPALSAAAQAFMDLVLGSKQ